MALKATIFKAELAVSDLDRGHFATHPLTIARHPSETDERMMVRVLAFALNADERLSFGRGLSSEGEADLVLTDLTGAIDLWIDVGLPDERDIRKASGRAARVAVYLYGTGAELWWRQNAQALERLANVSVVEIPLEATRALAARAARTMKLQCTVQEGHVWISDDESSIAIEPLVRKAAA
ncbi:MAG: YaeQ family protein [Betaproteobacteria bacterium]|nr:YaeQ family protein [Betaproteobacteria bacterium]